MGIFIQISIDESLLSAEQRGQLVGLCPVDIFALEEESLIAQADQEDECTLCNLCLAAAPPHAIRIHKTYTGETLISGKTA